MVATVDQVERVALELPCSDRAKLAERLWERVSESSCPDVVMTRELECLLDEGLEHLDRSQTTDSLRENPIIAGDALPVGGLAVGLDLD